MDPEPLRKLDIESVMKRKDDIEGELKELHNVLQSVSLHISVIHNIRIFVYAP